MKSEPLRRLYQVVHRENYAMQVGNVLLIDPLLRKAVVGNDLACFLYNYHLERWRTVSMVPLAMSWTARYKPPSKMPNTHPIHSLPLSSSTSLPQPSVIVEPTQPLAAILRLLPRLHA